jgi:hypothetical protein
MKYCYTGQLSVNVKVFMNRLGYHEQFDRRSGQTSFIRRLRSSIYPHFHIYLEEGNQGLMFNLHLDEKQPSYRGTAAHSGEYDGELVQKEMERIASQLR